MDLPEDHQPVPRLIALLVYPGFQAIDLAGPLQAFSTAAKEGGPRYEVKVLSAMGGPIEGAGPLTVATARWDDFRGAIDTLIIPGGPGVDAARADAAMRAAVVEIAGTARRVCSVCTGAFLLAASGLLDGRNACTHWRAAGKLAGEYPHVKVDAAPIFMRDGNVYTSAGVTAGIDLALALIEDDAGAACADTVARRLVVHVRRPGGQAQFSDALKLQSASGDVYGPLLAQMSLKPDAAWRVEDMAAFAGQSVRSFYRKFAESTQESPSSALERIRVEYAVNLLRTTSIGIKTVARRSGFTSDLAMRRAFLRVLGRLPSSMSHEDDHRHIGPLQG